MTVVLHAKLTSYRVAKVDIENLSYFDALDLIEKPGKIQILIQQRPEQPLIYYWEMRKAFRLLSKNDPKEGINTIFYVRSNKIKERKWYTYTLNYNVVELHHMSGKHLCTISDNLLC